MINLRALATDPTQYDNVGTDWLEEGGKDTPWRLFFKEILISSLADLKGQSVLDIGCGTGWMSEFVTSLGAKDYLGIEPSKTNFETAKSTHQNTRFINLPFEKFDTNQTFDLITCLMASEHLNNLEAAFVKWHRLLGPRGRLIIIAGDFVAFTMQKFDYQVEVENISNNEIVVHTKRPNSVDTVDIIRAPETFLSAAKAAGFTERTVTPLPASENLIKQVPKYKIFRHKPIFQLLVFGKSENRGEL